MSNVQVAVRVRPMNDRERTFGSKCIVEMDGPVTVLKHPTITEGPNAEKQFSFDYSYWSFDESNQKNFATQDKVFSDLGVTILDNAFEGFNCSIFAYGQTGSGKSYSMIGYGEDKGLIPKVCEDIFVRIQNNKEERLSYTVEVSFMEIYNETVKDLLNPKNNKKGGLKVRNHPKTGPYVEDLAKLAVGTYAEIESLMDEGSKSRTVAATNMNATSSRSHAVFTIVLTQTYEPDAKGFGGRQTVSKIHMVDLAGSERADSTGATGARLKEGANINKSLSTLGKVISALAKQAGGDAKAFVPYRDSVLTWLLKEALGGNSKTMMIAAISPADINYDETLSTLRYADSAKKIKNMAVVNEDPTNKLIRELQGEVENLRKQLQLATKGGNVAGLAEMLDADKDKQILDLTALLSQNEKLIAEMNKSWEEKLKESQAIQEERKNALKDMGIAIQAVSRLPHLINLNEDPILSGALIYYLETGETLLGTPTDEPDRSQPEIQLYGLNICHQHCMIEHREDGAVFITPLEGQTFVNGVKLSQTRRLQHGARIILGNNHIFRFSHPDEALKHNTRESGSVPDEEAIDYNFALSERAAVEVENSLGSNVLRFDMTTEEEKQLEHKIKAFNQEKEKEKENIQEQITKLTQEYEKQMLEFDALQQQESAPEAIAEITLRRDDVKQIYERKLHELETMKKSIAFTLRKQKEKFATFSFRIWNEKLDRQRLRERVLQTVVAIDQANAIIETLNNPNKRVHRTFELNLENTFPEVRDVEMDEFEANFGHYSKIKVGVKITNTQNGKHVICSSSEFAERAALMSEIYQNQVEFGRDGAIDTDSENSPFYISEHDERLVGAAHCYLKDMLYFNKAARTLPVLDLEGTAQGTLGVEISRQPLQVATDDSSIMHELGPSGASSAHEGDELLGQDLDFTVKLLRATDLPTDKFTDFQCRFSFRNQTPHKTEKGRVEGNQVVFDHEVHFSIFDVSEEFLYYLQQDALVVEIWGNALAEQPAGLGEKKPEEEDFVVLSTLSIEEKLESGEYKNVPVKQDPFSDPQVTFKLKRNQKTRRVHFSMAQPPGQTLLQIQGCESAQIGMFHRIGKASDVQASEEEMRMMFPLKVVKVQKDQLIAEWDLTELEAQHPNLLSVIVPPLRSRRKLSRNKNKKEMNGSDEEDQEDKISARVDFELNISTFSQPVKVSTTICLKYFVGQGLQRTDSEKHIINQLGKSDESPLDGAHFHIKLKKSRKMQDAQRITVFIEEQQQLQTRLGSAIVKERLRQELELHDRLEAAGASPTLHVSGSVSPRAGSTSPRKEVPVLAHRDVLTQRIADIERKSPARKKSDAVRRYKTLVKVEVEEIKGRLEAKKTGFLMKKSGSEWKKLWFVLTRAYLSYYKNENDLKPKGTMDLSSVKISALPQSQYMNTFALVSLGNVWVLQASTPEELQSWIEAIDPTTSIKETLETREKEMREEIERLKRDLEVANKAHSKAEEDRDVSRSSLTVLEDEFKANLREAEEKHARDLKQKDAEIDRLHNELEDFANEVNRLKERAKDDASRKANDARLEQLESSLKSTEDKLRDKDRELRDREGTIDDLQREVKKLSDQLKNSEGKLKIELDDIQFDLKRTQDKLARQEDEVRRRDSTIGELEDKVSRLERELDQKSQELARKNAESERSNRSLTRESSYRSVSSSNDNDMRQQLEEAQSTIEKLRAKVKEQNETINREIISGSSRSRRTDDDVDMTSYSNMQKAAKFDDVVAQNKRYEEEIQQLKAEIKQVRREVKFPELTSKQVKVDLTNLKDMASEYREREEEAKNKNRELQREIRTLKRDIEGLQRELNNVDRVKLENEKKMKRYQTIADEEAQRRIEAERNEKKTREELDILKEQHVDMQTQVTQLKSEIRILNRALDDVKTR